MNTADFIKRYPTLFHMAEAGSWPSIRDLGLMSTSAVLDHHGLSGTEREAIESGHRPTKLAVRAGAPGAIVLRDQIPMAPERLRAALGDHTTPEAWYRLINGKVFFWAEEHRLHNLLNARHYRMLEHDVLHVDTASLLSVHGPSVWLSRMNSGNTFPIPFPRNAGIFMRMADYPVSSRGRPIPEVVEVVVDSAVKDIAQHVTAVYRMRASETLYRIA